MNLNADAQKRVDQYLAEVRRHLSSRPMDEREEIVRELEAHIHEALAARDAGSPDAADVEAVLKTMDSPESFNTSGGKEMPPPLPDPRTTAGCRPELAQYNMSVPLYLVLTIITCGIFNLYWNFQQMEACNRLLGREEFDFWMWLILCIVTCGIYHIIYQYKMGAAILEVQMREGVATFDSLPVLSVLTTALGIPFVADCIHQLEINKLVRPY